MFICGSNFCGGDLSCSLTPTNLNSINKIILKNGMYDDLYITKDTSFALDENYVMRWDFDTILWAKFNGTTDAGNVDWNIDTISHIILKKRVEGKFTWRTLAAKEIKTKEDFELMFDDYTCASGAEYEYAIVPIFYGAEGNYSSARMKSQFDAIFIISEKDVYFTDITDGYCNTTRNIPSANVELLNQKFPIFVRNSMANYDTGSCTGSFVPFEDDGCTRDFTPGNNYKRIVFQRSVMDMLTDGLPKILKLPDGRLWLVQVTPNPTDSADQNYSNRNIAFTWVEIGSIESEKDLYYFGLSDISEEWWNS